MTRAALFRSIIDTDLQQRRIAHAQRLAEAKEALARAAFWRRVAQQPSRKPAAWKAAVTA